MLLEGSLKRSLDDSLLSYFACSFSRQKKNCVFALSVPGRLEAAT